jgi:Undecaprenyl-phosphate glucose phosphotransferase
MINSKQKLPILYLGGDMLTLILTFLISIYFFSDVRYRDSEWIILSGFILLWFMIGYWRKLYYLELNDGFNSQILNYIKTYSILVGLLYACYLLFPLHVPNSHLVKAFILGFPALGIPINFLIINFISQLERAEKSDQSKKPEENVKYTLVAGVGNLAENVEKHLYADQKSGYKIKGFINVKKKEECIVGLQKIVGDLDNIHQYLKENPIDEIVIALPFKKTKKIQKIISVADYHGVRVKYIPDYQSLFGKNYKMTRYGQLDAVNIRQLPLDETFAFFLKNSFDKIFSTVALILLSPVFLILTILIKLDSPGPVFYCPIRIGKGGRPFRVFKFRSMQENDTSSGGVLSTQKDDPRVTKIGKVMRKYSLDELPQFLNVLLGDMSVVGPRPHRSYLNQQLQESVDKYMVRHYFKPGITGWAQVSGWRGPTETKEQRQQRTLHDLWYIENWSLWLDIKIIYKTIFSPKTHNSAF